MTPLITAINRFDLLVTRAVQGLPAALNPLMNFISMIGHPGTTTVVGFALLCYAAAKRNYHLAGAALISLVALIFSPVLKQIWHRTRPDTAHAVGLHTYSFPSGHTYSSTLIYGLLAYLAWRHLPGVWHLLVPIALVVFIILVGISRVYLGAHYPTDVVGGWVLGVAILALIIRAGRI